MQRHADHAGKASRRMAHQQLQNANVLSITRPQAVQVLQPLPQLPERFGQFPIPHRRHMIQPRRLTRQRRHEVQRIDE